MAVARAPERAKNRKTHNSPPGARGFLLWRISYACRHPISFTISAVRRSLTFFQLRTLIHSCELLDLGAL